MDRFIDKQNDFDGEQMLNCTVFQQAECAYRQMNAWQKAIGYEQKIIGYQ